MKTLLNQNIEHLEKDPEVRSFIYQQIADFEAFVTPTTTVAVIAKNPVDLYQAASDSGVDVSKKDLAKMYRIAIVLSENGTKLEAEAVDYDIFNAIKRAKDFLLKKLITIQDHIISNNERLSEINQYLQNPIKH